MATVKELAVLVDGEISGDQNREITGFNDLAGAKPGEISFVADRKKQERLTTCRASALIVPLKFEPFDERPLIRVRDPYLAATLIQNFFSVTPFVAAGVHAEAVIGADCQVPAEVTIGPGVVLGERVRLGRRVYLGPGVVLGYEVEIGDDVVLHPNVTIYPRSVIGNRVIIHSGSVVGSDGFGYATDKTGRHIKRLHQGIVRIEDEVEIGANVCIDRGTFGATVIGAGSKIDNLVQIGHNVEVGERCLVVAQVGIAGSTRLGRQVVLGGQVGLSGHLLLRDGVKVAAQSGVHNDQPAGAVIGGSPAIDYKKWLRVCGALTKLPEMLRELRELRRRVEQVAAGSAAEPKREDTGDE